MAGTYPSLTTIRPSYYNEESPDWMNDKTIYQDGGADYRTYASTAIRRITILYSSDGGITASEAQQIIDLANDNRYSPQNGSTLTFTFTPRGESAAGGWRFDEGGLVVRRGSKAHIYQLEVRLIKRP